VPLYYESRLARIQLDEAEKPKIDSEIAELTEDQAIMSDNLNCRAWRQFGEVPQNCILSRALKTATESKYEAPLMVKMLPFCPI
jgi:hypothetical protein